MLTCTRSALVPLVVLGLALGVAGCGADEKNDEDDESASRSPTSTTASPASYLEVPEGVELTDPGTSLALGEEGVVAFQLRQDETAVLAVTVERIERTSFRESFKGWTVDKVTAARTPHFVRLKVTNAGGGNLGGRLLDNVIWAHDGTTLEAPSYYSSKQLPVCSGGPLPKPFATDATAELCQVYFIASDHELEAVTFQPPEGLDPITWTGALSKVQPPSKDRPRKKPRKKQ